MRKSTVYIETSIVSYLAARRSRNLIAAAWQEISWEFWDSHRGRYELYTSEIVIDEVSAGEPEAAERRLDLLLDVPRLSVDEKSRTLAAAILSEKIVPPNAEIDALHIAVASVNAMDYLLTWNCRHIDNPTIKPALRHICERFGYVCPEICTPFQLTEVTQNDR